MEATTVADERAGSAGKPAKKPIEQVVLREFPQVGKYRVRLVRGMRESSQVYLDIREYANSESFQGFTRRGIRLKFPEDAAKLQLALEEALTT